MRKSFTLIELLFVIIILGILGTLSSDIVLNIYRTYVLQKGATKIEMSLKTTVEQISNYLDRAIKPSVVVDNGSSNYEAIDYVSRSNGDFSNNPSNVLLWIGKDLESQQGMWKDSESRVYSGYSGFASVKSSSGLNIISNDNDLSFVDEIQRELTKETTTANRSALYFVYANSQGSTKERFWSNLATSLFPINSFSGDTIVVNKRPKEIGDIYYLTYSAYAITLKDGKLNFIWNFRPWNGETYRDGESRLLLENVSSFQVWGESEGIIHLQICATDSTIQTLLGDDSWEFCKESVIVR